MLLTFHLTSISLKEIRVKFNLTRRVGKKKKNKLISLEIRILMVVYKKHFLFLTSKLPLANYNSACSMENYIFFLPVVVLLLLP